MMSIADYVGFSLTSDYDFDTELVSNVAYRPLVELVALFALTIRCRGLHTADINDFTGRTTNFFHPRVRFLRDHFSTQGRRA